MDWSVIGAVLGLAVYAGVVVCVRLVAAAAERDVEASQKKKSADELNNDENDGV